MLDPIPFSGKSLATYIADKLREHIISSGLKPGSRLPNETELCATLGVGRGTIREAMKILASKNIVSIQRGNGTFVSENPGQLDDPFGLSFLENKSQVVLELLQLRLMIEPDLVRLAATNANEQDILLLEEIEEKLEDCYHQDRSHVEEDVEFHSTIARCSHNRVVDIIFPVLTKTIPELSTITNGIRYDDTIMDHRKIIDSIRNHELDSAELAMKNHIQRNIDFLNNLIKEKS